MSNSAQTQPVVEDTSTWRDQLVETENQYGFKDCFMNDDHQYKMPVCSQCGSYKMWNRGQGTMCEPCITQDILECQHDDHWGAS